MAVNVNPPPQIFLPKGLSDLGIDVVNYFQQQARFDLQLWTRVGGPVDIVNQAATNFNINLVSSIFDIRQQIGSEIAITIDASGFTVDTSEQTTDQTEQ